MATMFLSFCSVGELSPKLIWALGPTGKKSRKIAVGGRRNFPRSSNARHRYEEWQKVAKIRSRLQWGEKTDSRCAIVKWRSFGRGSKTKPDSITFSFPKPFFVFDFWARGQRLKNTRYFGHISLQSSRVWEAGKKVTFLASTCPSLSVIHTKFVICA